MRYIPAQRCVAGVVVDENSESLTSTDYQYSSKVLGQGLDDIESQHLQLAGQGFCRLLASMLTVRDSVRQHRDGATSGTGCSPSSDAFPHVRFLLPPDRRRVCPSFPFPGFRLRAVRADEPFGRSRLPGNPCRPFRNHNAVTVSGLLPLLQCAGNPGLACGKRRTHFACHTFDQGIHLPPRPSSGFMRLSWTSPNGDFCS